MLLNQIKRKNIKKTKNLIFLMLFAVLLLMSSFSVLAENACISPTANYTCGDYIQDSCELNGTISLSGGTCFYINSSNIQIDGKGYSIDGVDNSAVGIDTDGYDNINISNLVMTDLGWAIYSNTSDNIKITNVNVSSGSQLVFSKNSVGLNVTDSNCNDVTDCILLENTTSSYFSNINVDTCSDVGFYAYGGSHNNILKDSTISNCVYGIYDEQSNYNNYTGIKINGTGTFGVTFDASLYSNLINSTITGQTYDIYSTNSYATEPDNNVINVSFDDSKSVADSGAHYVKWYVDVYVNDTLGNNLDGATVTGKDKDNNQIFSLLTDSIGYITRQKITEYKQNSSGKFYYNNYTFTASKTDYSTDSQTVNITNNILNKNITLTLNYNVVEDLSSNKNNLSSGIISSIGDTYTLIVPPTHYQNRSYREGGLIAPYLYFNNVSAFYEAKMTFNSDDYVSHADNDAFDMGTSDMTFTWYGNTTGSQQGMVFQHGAISSSYEGYRFYWNTNGNPTIQISNGTSRVSCSPYTQYDDYSEHFWAVVIDRDEKVELFRDGISIYNCTSIKVMENNSITSNQPFYLGAAGGSLGYSGTIKNFQIYHRSLSRDEIYTAYLNGQPKQNTLSHNTNWTNVNDSMKMFNTNKSYFYKIGTNQTHDFGGIQLGGPGKITDSVGLQIDNEDNIKILNCLLNEFGYGVYLTGDYDNNLIDSCLITNTSYGVYYETGYKTYPTNTNVTNTKFNLNNISIYFEEESVLNNYIFGVTLSNNSINNSETYGIFLPKNIEAIRIYDNNFYSNDHSIYLTQTKNINIINNTFNSDNISIRTKSETNLTIKENIINSTNKYGIYSTYAKLIEERISEDNSLIENNTFNLNNIAMYIGNDGFNITHNNFNSNTKATILPIFCNNYISSTNKDNDKPIMYYNNSNHLFENINSYGAFIFCGASNITLDNISLSNITNTLVLSGSDIILNNSEIKDNHLGIYSFYSNFDIISSIFSSNNEDIYLTSYSNGESYSTSLTNSKVSADSTSSFHKKWHLIINVSNTLGTKEEGANVTIYDKNNNLITSQLTDSNGIVDIWLDEISISSGITTEYNPYKIEINNGVSGNISYINMTSDKTHNVTLTAMSCGATILYDTKLYQNYSCSGNGFILGADGIIFDCDGYSIIGDNGTGSWSNPDKGIMVNGKDNVTIKNCIIKDFDAGIDVSSTTPENAVIQDNTIQNTNLYAIGLWSGANNAIIQRNTLENGDGHGIMLTQSIMNGTIRYNSIDNFNGTGHGISLDNSKGIQIYSNNVSNSYAGIMLGNNTNTSTIFFNILDSNDYNFVLMYKATNNTIYENTFKNSVNENLYLSAYDSITERPSNNLLYSNTITNSGTTDIKLYYAENNTIKDTSFDDISLENSPNTTLLNTTYTTINFVDSSVSSIYRKWYVDFYVNDSIGNEINNAKIKIDNSDSSNQLIAYTDANGQAKANISQYKQTGSGTTDYLPLNITASKTAFAKDSKLINITTNTEVNLTLGCSLINSDDNYITSNTAICMGEYNINDDNYNGVLIINSSNVVVDCSDSNITGIRGKAVTLNENSNVSIINCNFKNYEWGVEDIFYSSLNSTNNYINNSFSEINRPIVLYSNNNYLENNRIISTNRKTILPIEMKYCNDLVNNTINNKDIIYEKNVIFEIETPLRIQNQNTKGHYILCDVHNAEINNISISDAAGVYLVNSTYVGLSNSSISNSYYGVYLDSDSSATVESNTFDDDEIGIRVLGSNSDINNNTFTTNKQYAFYITNCNNNFISNTADEKQLSFISNTANSNIIDSSSYSQIEYCNVSNSKITGLTMNSGSYGLILYNSNNINVNDSTINSVYNAIRAYNSDYITINNNSLNGNNERAIDSNYCDYIDIIDNEITGSRGIWLYFSDNADVLNNSIDSISYNGIEFAYSTNGEFQNNNITNVGDYGLFLRYGSNNTIINNTKINSSGKIDVLLRNVKNITLRNTQITNTNINERSLRIDGASLEEFIHNIDTSNTINNKIVRYLVNYQNYTVPENPGYVGIVNSQNITLNNTEINKNGEGVLVAYSDSVNINLTNLTNNSYGLKVYNSNITLNDLWVGESDLYGIYLYDSLDSTITMTNSLSCGSETKDIYSSGYTISSSSDNYCDTYLNWDDEGGNVTDPSNIFATGCRHSCYSPKWKRNLPTIEFYEDRNKTINLSKYCTSYYPTDISYVGQDKSGVTILENEEMATIYPATSWVGWENTTFNATNSVETVASRDILEFNIIEIHPPVYVLNLTSTSQVHNATIKWEDVNGEGGYSILCANSLSDFRNGNWVVCGNLDENSTQWTDTNAVDYNERYYKVASKTVRDVNKIGELVVGKINYGFKNEINGNENIFALPLDKDSLRTLEDLYRDINDTSAVLYYFNPSTQDTDTACYSTGTEILCNNMNLVNGSAYILITGDSDKNYSLGGKIPEMYNITLIKPCDNESQWNCSGRNYISVPLNSTITSPSGFMDVIESSTSANVKSITYLNPTTQQKQAKIDIGMPFDLGTNFDILPWVGYEIELDTDSSGTFIWTQK